MSGFEYGDKVMWKDRNGNPYMGTYHHEINEYRSMVMVDDGVAETRLTDSLTKVTPLSELVDEPMEDAPAPTCEFSKGDIVTWTDSEGETQVGTYYRIFRDGYGEVMTEPGYYQDVPLESLKLAPKPDFKRGDRVEWQADDGLLREGEFRHESSAGTAYVQMSRTISSYVPMHKLRKIDPSA